MVIKVFLLMLFQSGLNRLKPLYDRFIVRDVLSHGKELPMTRWFDINFWKSLTPHQLLSLSSLAFWKVLTFPLGVWIGSFSLVLTYPLSNLIGNVMAIIIHPIMLFIAYKGLNEFVVNAKTITGFGVVIVSLVLGAFGWYLIYSGGQ